MKKETRPTEAEVRHELSQLSQQLQDMLAAQKLRKSEIRKKRSAFNELLDYLFEITI